MTTEMNTTTTTAIPELHFLTCTLCGWEFLPEERAVIPALDIITERRNISLEDVVLENHACCRKCSAEVQEGCPEAKFYPFLTTQRLIARLLANKAEKITREAEKAKRELIAARNNRLKKKVLRQAS